METNVTDKTKTRRGFLVGGAALAGAAVLSGCGSQSAPEPAAAPAPEPSGLVLDAPPVTSMEIVGTTDRFPVRRVYCLGRNYAAHAIESGDDPTVTPPFFFMKPTDAVIEARAGFPYPPMTNALRYEAELVVALKSGGTNISEADSLNHVFGYGCGLDMTRQDLQVIAQELSRPWAISKSFDKSAPCGPLYPVEDFGHAVSGRIWLSVNDELKQDSDLNMQIWSVPQAIAILSQYYELFAGDIIMTGTPENIGLVNRGDVVKSGIDGLGEIEVLII